MSFKVGEHVAVYEGGQRMVGVVGRIGEDGVLTVMAGAYLYVHPKQCRKLVKRKPLCIWVPPAQLNMLLNMAIGTEIYVRHNSPSPEDIEFVQVLYQCEQCGCIENTALGWCWCRNLKGSPDHRKLCSACAPTHFTDGSPTGMGKWHDRFPQRFYPVGTMETDEVGNIREKRK